MDEKEKLRREQEHLEEILKKLQIKVRQVKESLQEGEKDIEEMHEYYWENYTEMDEYGYENFDNQQALLSRVNDAQAKKKELMRYQKMQDSPYFGKIDFIYEGEEEPESFYIGIGNFAENMGSMPLVFDWRAPVSSLFYDFDKGPASYQAPGGEMSGEVSSKWQYKIKHGVMQYGFESDIKIDDEILKQELGNHADASLRSIVSSIQKEQNAIIRNRQDKILVVQGCAGSGKTSVALHRIAYLLYHERKTLSAGNVLILSPNSIFSDYISHILPELGEEHIREMSFDDFAYRECRGITDVEDRYDQIERSLTVEMEHPEIKKRRLKKQSAEYAQEIYGYVLGLESEGISFCDIHYKKIEKNAKEIEELFYYKFPDIPFLKRMEIVAEYLIDEEETLRDQDMDPIAKEIFMDLLLRFYKTRDIYVLYSDFLECQGEEALPQLPVEQRYLSYEDVFPLLYMKYLLCGTGEQKKVKHLIIDEMQDYSYLQYLIIQKLFSCKMTILGDRAQTMEEQQQDVMRFLPKIFGKNIRMLQLNKSYRSTAEIAGYAAEFTDVSDVEIVNRHGKSPEVLEGKEELYGELVKRMEEDVRKGHETIGILCMTEQEAKELHEKIKVSLEQPEILGGTEKTLSYLDKNSRKFQPGIAVTTFYLAKGLEFDSVHVWTKAAYTMPIHRQAMYICATRALHELTVYKMNKQM